MAASMAAGDDCRASPASSGSSRVHVPFAREHETDGGGDGPPPTLEALDRADSWPWSAPTRNEKSRSRPGAISRILARMEVRNRGRREGPHVPRPVQTRAARYRPCRSRTPRLPVHDDSSQTPPDTVLRDIFRIRASPNPACALAWVGNAQLCGLGLKAGISLLRGGSFAGVRGRRRTRSAGVRHRSAAVPARSSICRRPPSPDLPRRR